MLDCEMLNLWQRQRAVTLVFKKRSQIIRLILRLTFKLLFKPGSVGTFIRLYFEDYVLSETEKWEALFSDEDITRMKQEVAT